MEQVVFKSHGAKANTVNCGPLIGVFTPQGDRILPRNGSPVPAAAAGVPFCFLGPGGSRNDDSDRNSGIRWPMVYLQEDAIARFTPHFRAYIDF